MINVTDIFIDKLSLSYHTSECSAEAIRDNISELKKSKALHIHQRGMDYQGRGYKYNFVIHITTHPLERFLVMCCPLRPNSPQIIVELNPHRLSEADMFEFWDALELILLMEMEDFIEEATVSRLDLAFDASPLSPNSFEVFANNLHLGDRRTGARGETTSFYLGSRKSDLHFCIYNRDEYTRERVANNHGTTRFEARIKPHVPLRELHRVQNPFTKLKVIRALPQSVINELSTRHRMFWGAVQFHGLQGAKSLITRHETRTSYINHFEQLFTPEWYVPRELWRGYIPALNELRLDHIGVSIQPRRRRRRTLREVTSTAA